MREARSLIRSPRIKGAIWKSRRRGRVIRPGDYSSEGWTAFSERIDRGGIDRQSAPFRYGLMSTAASLRLKIGGDAEFLPYSCFL